MKFTGPYCIKYQSLLYLLRPGNTGYGSPERGKNNNINNNTVIIINNY